MAKTSKKKSNNEPISVSEIYETIQARDFLKELWWDLISDIQEKPTYKRIKGMVKDVINNTVKNFTSKSVDGNEELKRRAGLHEISIMTYTLDTVISEVLYRRYQNEFEDIIKKLIEDLLKSRTKEASNPVEGESVFENIEEIFNEGIKVNDHSISNAENADKSNDAPKRGRPKKIIANEEKAKNITASGNKKRGRPAKIPNTNVTGSLKDKIKSQDIAQGSDAESEISVGNFSIESVSSVHTSELSSFEDTVSLCSDDEGKKKRIPLKIANDMYLQGNLSQIYQIGKKSEKFKLKKNASASSKSLTKANNSSSHAKSRKVLPQRNRKPNSKYSSETMESDIKDYSSPPADSESSSSQDESEDKSSASPKMKRKRKSSSFSKETVGKSPQRAPSSRNSSPLKRGKTNNSNLSKASTKRYDTSDLYKPRTATGNNTGTRSTAITLFST